MKKGQHQFIVMDFETGGLDSDTDAVTEVALIVLDGDSLEEIERYESHISPYDMNYSPKALEYTKKSMQILEERGRPYEEVCEAIYEILKRHVLSPGKWARYPIMVGHNFAKFDMGFLMKMMSDAGKDISKLVEPYIEDTLIQARRTWLGTLTKFDLTACCLHIGHQLTNAHTAMPDVEGNVKLFKHFIQLTRGGAVASKPVKKARESFKF